MTNSLFQTTKWLLHKSGIRARKYLGQNFLIDEKVLQEIIESANLSQNDFILEIGAGPGILTKEVAKKVKKIIAVEVDQNLVRILRENLSDCGNAEVISGDVLRLNLASLFPANFPVKVIANLPYYITTPIIMHLLEQRFSPCTKMIVMVQKEVALRIVASPESRDYGVFSVVVQYYAKPELISIVSRKAFFPSPKVDSAVVRLTVRENPPVKVRDENLLFKIVKASFSHRRKTIINSLLKSHLGLDKVEIAELLNNARIGPGLRAESLSLQDFARLANKYDYSKEKR